MYRLLGYLSALLTAACQAPAIAPQPSRSEPGVFIAYVENRDDREAVFALMSGWTRLISANGATPMLTSMDVRNDVLCAETRSLPLTERIFREGAGSVGGIVIRSRASTTCDEFAPLQTGRKWKEIALRRAS